MRLMKLRAVKASLPTLVSLMSLMSLMSLVSLVSLVKAHASDDNANTVMNPGCLALGSQFLLSPIAVQSNGAKMVALACRFPPPGSWDWANRTLQGVPPAGAKRPDCIRRVCAGV